MPKKAAYIAKTYKEVLLLDANSKLKLVSQPSSYTLVLELAIIELVPSKAVTGMV